MDMKNLQFTPAAWYHSRRHQVSYQRIYKSGSSSMVALMGAEEWKTFEPVYPRRFVVLREPFSRSYSIYKELIAMKLVSGSYGDYLRRTVQEGFFNKHQLPQVFWIRGYENTMEYFMLSDLSKLCRWLDVSLEEIPKLNKRPGNHVHGEDEVILVKALYRDDFNLCARVNAGDERIEGTKKGNTE